MSSSHIVIIARNDITGEIELPLEDMTLYGCGGEEKVLETCRANYSMDWTLSLYRPYGISWAGCKTK
jgi:hypothetical protein